MLPTDNSKTLVQLWGGPSDGELRRLDPSDTLPFWVVPNFAQSDPWFHQNRHFYAMDPKAGKAKFVGIQQAPTATSGGWCESEKQPWE